MERHVESVQKQPKPAAQCTCDPPPDTRTHPSPNAPLYRHTGRQAGVQAAFSGGFGCVLLYSKDPWGLREPPPKHGLMEAADDVLPLLLTTGANTEP